MNVLLLKTQGSIVHVLNRSYVCKETYGLLQCSKQMVDGPSNVLAFGMFCTSHVSALFYQKGW